MRLDRSLSLICCFISMTLVASQSEPTANQSSKLCERDAVMSPAPQLLLMHAIEKSDKEAMGSLLDFGMDPDWRDGDGCTPLRFAAFKQDEEATRLLLKYGACAYLVSDKGGSNGITVIEEVESASYYCGLERRGLILGILLEHGCRAVCKKSHRHRNPQESVDALKSEGESQRAERLQIGFQEAKKAMTDDSLPLSGAKNGKTGFLQPPSPRWHKRANSL